ncbi:hypothetical protein [Gellertiella hungarica]|uniref:Ribbon-helix-helix protein CopG domain-containing protein n=1 Tax=Gellertiella hungarica TaxID=1572859 RepID=A0A7W6J2M6_9HYPH|nr:hypothetical protein [Gellertiella hungarica]MBB4063643.1 hypothetical protein [Gellertiella hungarica]
MSRPKLSGGETVRVQVKISDAQLEAINDWRFQNRISTLSEAIRKLCEIGVQTGGDA